MPLIERTRKQVRALIHVITDRPWEDFGSNWRRRNKKLVGGKGKERKIGTQKGAKMSDAVGRSETQSVQSDQ